ncbi:TetR/AcrR family transcriptional regulator [Sporichthya sp.]|uniref:TetR/AcrR family transcriptional regulator n=1 Tax=Sporichthya sp. TaxID=65475 RepID=UPI0017FB0B35|nr:TetR/AcrR family transcriptional regulator [Sporichthya sp.]MBA3741823.1 TetR/AcrR family transcriptional regulator [Sporichthya sp.]
MDRPEKRTRRPRRPAEEVRPLLLAAARDLFLTRGYHSTTTRDIAARAGVAETMLFRYCGSKTRLFEDVVLEPFQEFMAQYMSTWEQRITETHSTEDVIRSFVTGFYMLLRQHRELVLVLAAARVHPDDPLHHAAMDVADKLAKTLGQMEGITTAERTTQRLGGIDAPITAATGIGMVMALALLDDWLMAPGNPKPAASRITNEITTMILHGISHRPSA